MMVGNYKSSKKAISSLILVMLWILFSNAHLRAEKLLVDGIVEATMPCVVQIHTYDKIGEFWGYGTGFFIAPGKILTCAHVMEDAYSAIVISNIKNYNQVKILKMDEDRDLALLMINASGEKFLQLENEKVPIRNQNLIAIGYNYDEDKIDVSYGLVHAIISSTGIQKVISSIPIFFGWSGSPLLNLEGDVIGVNSSFLGDGPKIGISTGIEAIKEFLEEPNNPQNLAYAESSELRSVILEKLGVFWGVISGWIVNPAREVIEFIFFHGVLRGVFIIILIGGLIGWRSRILYRFIRARKRRKAVNKIIKWSDGASSIEVEPVLETKGHKSKYRAFADNEGDKIVLDRSKIEERVELILRRCKASSGMTEEIKEL